MLLALTGYETALVVVALAFIAFALVVALVIPRSRPDVSRASGSDFPRGLRRSSSLAQMTAVLVLAEVGEADEPVHGGVDVRDDDRDHHARDDTETDTETTQTETTEAAGDPAAGKEVFLGTAGCSGCHTLSDAAATGTIGPNLDAVKPSVRQGRLAGDERWRRDASVRRHAHRAADPGRRGVRLVGHAGARRGSRPR